MQIQRENTGIRDSWGKNIHRKLSFTSLGFAREQQLEESKMFSFKSFPKFFKTLENKSN